MCAYVRVGVCVCSHSVRVCARLCERVCGRTRGCVRVRVRACVRESVHVRACAGVRGCECVWMRERAWSCVQREIRFDILTLSFRLLPLLSCGVDYKTASEISHI
jgi:hypothetical protein